jgi:hypothetical protein
MESNTRLEDRHGCPLVEALSFVFQGNEGVELFDYSCAHDFQRLWSFRGIAAKRILVVWSQTALDPELSPINTADCLSPVDWAVCFAAQRKDAPDAWPDVMILDTDAARHSRIPSVAHLSALKAERLPWLRLEPDVQLSSIIEWLENPRQRGVGRCKTAVERFLREIRLSLTEVRSEGTYDRHAISNIIGPMVLRGQEANKTLHSAALLSLLRTCGLVPPFGPATETASDGPVTETGEGLGVLLVDDQAGHGWAAWVREALPKAGVSVLTSPVELVEAVERQLKEAQTDDLRFRLALPGLPAGRPPVLLLDLRLFSGNAGAELEFYRNTLLPLIRTYFLDRTNLAWSSFSIHDEAFSNAVSAVEDGSLFLGSKKSERREVLTWLPRLLALADMSLPIILFSSTGRRELVKPFRDYGNIITSFEKLRFVDLCDGSTAGSVAGRCVSELQSALHVARHHAAPRPFALGLTHAPPQAQNGSGTASETSGKWNIVIHIDESGTWNGEPGSLKLGALVSVFPMAKSEWDIDEAISRSHGGARTGKAYCRNPANLADMLTIAEQEGARLGYMELSAGDEMIFAGRDTSDEFHDEWVADNLWRQMFVRLIECSIFGVGRWLLPDGGRLSSMSVRAPTRGIPLDVGLSHLARESEQRKRLVQRRKSNLFNKWGIETVPVGQKAPLWTAIEALENCRSDAEPRELWNLFVEGIKYFKPRPPPPQLVRFFDYADARPIVESVVQLYRHTGFVPRSQLVRAFNLNSHGTARSKYIPALHFAVDGVLDVRELPPCVRKWGIDYGPGLDRLLRTNRLLLGNDTIAAALALKDAYTLIGGTSPTFLVSLEGDVAASLQRVNGGEYLRLGDEWPEDVVFALSVGRIEGRVVRASGADRQHRNIVGADAREYFAPYCAIDIGKTVSFRPSTRRGVMFPGEAIIVTDVGVVR